MSYELKHIRGIPYYLDGNVVKTFELDGGKPSADCVAIGIYDATKDSITYHVDWLSSVQSHLDAFRASLSPQERDKLRETIAKPQKQRKTTRNPRKTSGRTKSTKSE